MRKIIYRGKRVEDKKPLIGHLLKAVIEGKEYYFIIPEIIVCDVCNYQISIDFWDWEVIPETIGEYTGISNEESDMVEGDIVLYDDLELGIIEYCGKEGYPAFDVKYLKEYYGESNIISASEADACTLKVVGNVVDDKELAEKIRKGENYPESHQLITDNFSFQCPECGEEEVFLESMSIYDSSNFKIIKGDHREFRDLESGIVMCKKCHTIFGVMAD